MTVRTDIPYGNACGITVEESAEGWVVSFTPDPKGGPEVLWFCLRMEGGSSGKGVKVVLRHVGNMLGGSDPGKINPVIKMGEDDWSRVGPGTCEELPDGRRNAIWNLPNPDRAIDLALCYPYGRPDVESLISETAGYWESAEIGMSQRGRPLTRLSNRVTGDTGVPGIYLIARQHSGEAPGSWVLDGFLRRIAEEGGDAPLVWAIPLADIDGIEEGAYGKDRFPYDLNRSWAKPAMRHEVLAYQKDMDRWSKRCSPLIGIDFHAPGCCEDRGIYAFLPKPDAFPEAHEAASKAAETIGSSLEPYAADEFGRIATYKSRWNTRGFTSQACSMGFISMCLETPYHQIRDMVMTRERYKEAGAKVAQGVLDLVPEAG